MEPLNTLNTTGPIDYDNLNIVIRPRPRRRRQSGISLIPFRPYVKCLTSVKEPYSFANGKDPWVVIGEHEEGFQQKNARCIGSLLDDCDVSDVIRWDIEADSTRLPMVCKLWMIVDGTVIERGKPHLVQDAAIQVFTEKRSRRSMLSNEQCSEKTQLSTFNRRRRHSWLEVNEYHSVSYYQYTRPLRLGNQESVQCDLDNEQFTSQQNVLPSFQEEVVEENDMNEIVEHKAQETVHNHIIPQDRVHVSMMTQTENSRQDRETSIDEDFIRLFNLHIQTNDAILSPIANPYISSSFFNHSNQIESFDWSNVRGKDQSVSTGDDYPSWWLQMSTNVLLSNSITKQSENKKNNGTSESPKRNPPASVDVDDSERDANKTRPTSSRSSRIHKSSTSSMTVSNHYEFIDETDDGNNARRNLSITPNRQRVDSHCDVDSHVSDYGNYRRKASSSKLSDSDYHTMSCSRDQSCSTSELHPTQVSYNFATNEANQNSQENAFGFVPTGLLNTLRERYEKTVREREKPIVIVNDQRLEIDDLLKRYKEKMYGSTVTIRDQNNHLYQNISEAPFESEDEHHIVRSCAPRISKTKYRSLPSVTSKDMIQGYIPSPRLCLTSNSTVDSPRQRQPRFDYCDLCLIDHSTNSAWIKYNEQRIDELQKRIDLMLQIDDNDETHFLFSAYHPIMDTVSQRIDDVLLKKPKRQYPAIYLHDRILSPRRYTFRLPGRVNQSLPDTPRISTRNVSRSTNPIAKTVRISTDHDLIPNQARIRPSTASKSASRPIVSILRRNNSTVTQRKERIVEPSHIWKNESDGTIYVLNQFSIPRYYRLYNDTSFREVYNFSRLLEIYTHQNRATEEDYTTMVKRFALKQELPPVTTIAYDDMVVIMKHIVETYNDLTNDELSMILLVYKKQFSSRNSAWRIVDRMFTESVGNESKQKIIMEYREKVARELKDTCFEVLVLLDNYFIPSSTSNSMKIKYFKNKGDYYRYLAEVVTGMERRKLFEESELAYSSWLNTITNEESPVHATRLSSAMDAAMFYYDILNKPDSACSIAEQTFEEALLVINTVDETSYRDSIELLQLLHDYGVLWKNTEN